MLICIWIQNTYLLSGLSGCCSTLQIVSTGVAQEARPEWLGTYGYYTNHNKYNAYNHIGQERFLYLNPYGQWTVSKIRLSIFRWVNIHIYISMYFVLCTIMYIM